MDKKLQDTSISYISEDDSEVESKVKKIKKKLKNCRAEKEDYLSQLQRTQADFANYQKRTEERIKEIKKYAGGELIAELLSVLESLEMGASTNEGLIPIKDQLESVLRKHGLEKIECLDQKFNPNYHEAVEEEESDKENGTIIEEYQKGYMLHDKLLRPSRVKIAK